MHFRLYDSSTEGGSVGGFFDIPLDAIVILLKLSNKLCWNCASEEMGHGPEIHSDATLTIRMFVSRRLMV